jgi:hypothetical protein
VTGAPETPSPAAILYPSAAKQDTPAAAPGSTGTKPAAASPAPASPSTAAAPAKGATWKAPGSTPATTPAQSATAAQAPKKPPAEPAALYVEPLKTMAEAVAATPIADADAANFDHGDEGKQAREAVRSAFLAAGASKDETAELWGIAVEAARPDARITTADEAERELRAAWGGNYEARLASVRGFFKGVAQRHPDVADDVRKLNLDNSARFLMALHKAAHRRGR